MKKYSSLIIALFAIFQIMALMRIGSLQNQLQNVSNQLSHVQSNLSGQINALNSRITSLSKEQGSILERFDYTLGAVDRDKLTVSVTFTVVPKETKADTKAMLYVGAEPVAMVKQGGAYVATHSVDIFAAFDAKVVLSDCGLERTALLDARENLRERVLPIMYVRLDGISGAGASNGYRKAVSGASGEFVQKGVLYIETKPVVGNTIEKARLVIDINGAKVSEKPVNASGTPIDEKFTLVAGQTLTMMIEATDSFGLVHKVVMNQFTLDSNAMPVARTDFSMMDQATIVDRNGTVRYTPRA